MCCNAHPRVTTSDDQAQAQGTYKNKEYAMNVKKVFIGVIIWTISLSTLLLYHALLMHAAVQEEGHIYSYHVMVKYFFDLPWIVWPYLIASGVIGTVVIISGLKSEAS